MSVVVTPALTNRTDYVLSVIPYEETAEVLQYKLSIGGAVA
jgi:hypothetical protein